MSSPQDQSDPSGSAPQDADTLIPVEKPKSSAKKRELTDPQSKKSDSRDTTHAERLVAVGASAGGLEALEAFFGAIEPNPGCAVVVVTHLSPDFSSMLDELLEKRTRMHVQFVQHNEVVRPNTVYLNTPRTDIRIENNRFLLEPFQVGSRVHHPIDTFFFSVASHYGRKGVGIILSGSGSDGSRGLPQIALSGGLTMVQSPETAGFNGMPLSAIQSCDPDFILPPQEMARMIRRKEHESSNASDGYISGPEEAKYMEGILEAVQQGSAIDFTAYKRGTIERRVARRCSVTKKPSLKAYRDFVQESPEEQSALFHDLLIGVTQFFRDPEAFQLLEQEALPELAAASHPGKELRVWVAACASGEEAYSMAILLHQFNETHQAWDGIKIFATDVHDGALAHASKGVYSPENLAMVSPEQRKRYFRETPAGPRVMPELREMVVFARHNVIEDTAFRRIDLLSCRNLLIYFNQPAQHKVLSRFHMVLNRGGVLFLGPSETLGDLEGHLESISGRWNLYRKIKETVPTLSNILDAPRRTERIDHRLVARTASTGPDPRLIHGYDAVLAHFSPAGLLVDADRHLLHTFGDVSRHVAVRPGRASNDVLDMMGRDVAAVFGAAFYKVLSDHKEILYTHVPTGEAAPHDRIHLRLTPLESTTGDLFVHVGFEEPAPDKELPGEDEARTVDASPVSGVHSYDTQQMDRLKELERELRQTRETLNLTLEQADTTREELQATNEELVAANEELQSTNEELQSVNEELYSVNAEYQEKISELVLLANDMDNLLRHSGTGMIFLDRELHVRKFNPAVTQVFRVLPQDEGRPFTHLTHDLEYPELHKHVTEALHSGQGREVEVRTRSASWYLVRLQPYRTEAGVVDGLLISMIDISELRQAQDSLRDNKFQFDLVQNNCIDGFWDWDMDTNVEFMSDQLKAGLGYEPRDIENNPAGWRSHAFPDDLAELDAALERHMASGGTQPFHVEMRLRHKDGSLVWVARRGIAVRNDMGVFHRMLGVHIDITQLKSAMAELSLVQRTMAFGLRLEDGRLGEELSGSLESIKRGLGADSDAHLEPLLQAMRGPRNLLVASQTVPQPVTQHLSFGALCANLTADHWLPLTAIELDETANSWLPEATPSREGLELLVETALRIVEGGNSGNATVRIQFHTRSVGGQNLLHMTSTNPRLGRVLRGRVDESQRSECVLRDLIRLLGGRLLSDKSTGEDKATPVLALQFVLPQA